MATGLPVVAFDNPVSREYLGDDGIYAPGGDVSALASGIERLLSNPAGAQETGRRLRARAIERFAWDASARKIEQAYEAALAAQGARPRVPRHAPEPGVGADSAHRPVHKSPNVE
jgi:glycosyltransferase involved in cell wall biosynthesis